MLDGSDIVRDAILRQQYRRCSETVDGLLQFGAALGVLATAPNFPTQDPISLSNSERKLVEELRMHIVGASDARVSEGDPSK